MKKISIILLSIIMILNLTGCISKSSNQSIPTKTLNKLNKTTKIVVKYNNQDIGTIEDNNKLKEILNTISSSKQDTKDFLCDSNAFEFLMFDKNNKLIDTIYIWSDGKRLIPSSIHSGCSYYSIQNDINLMNIIEEETNFNEKNLWSSI